MKFFNKSIYFLVLVVVIFGIGFGALAQTAPPVNPGATFEKEEWQPLSEAPETPLPGGKLAKNSLGITNVLATAAGALVSVVGGAAFVMLIVGALQLLLSSGNEEKVGKAKKTIVWAVFGIVIVFLSYAIVSWAILGSE